MAAEALFREADADGDGRITGAEAVAFFSRAGLPTSTLAEARVGTPPPHRPRFSNCSVFGCLFLGLEVCYLLQLCSYIHLLLAL